MTVTKLTIEIDDGEPVVITAGREEDRRAEPRTMAADYAGLAPPHTRLRQETATPDGHTSVYNLSDTVVRYEWNAERRQLAVKFKGGTRITFSFVAGEDRSRD